MDAVLILESNIRSYNVPQSTPRLRVPLEATPGNVSFRSQATSKIYCSETFKGIMVTISVNFIFLFQLVTMLYKCIANEQQTLNVSRSDISKKQSLLSSSCKKKGCSKYRLKLLFKLIILSSNSL